MTMYALSYSLIFFLLVCLLKRPVFDAGIERLMQSQKFIDSSETGRTLLVFRLYAKISLCVMVAFNAGGLAFCLLYVWFGGPV